MPEPLTDAEIKAAFDAVELWNICRAADQDGWDGGFLRVDDDGETWASTKEELRKADHEIKRAT